MSSGILGGSGGQVWAASTGRLDISLISSDAQSFPYIYLTVQVNEEGQPTDSLDAGNFYVEENGILQTNSFGVIPPGSSGNVRMTDIVFLIDVSGSMQGRIEKVTNNCEAFAEELTVSGIDYRLGLVQYGHTAYDGHPWIRGDGLTDDILEFKNWLETISVNGGYEYGFEAIRFAILNYNFRAGAQKVFILISDDDSDDRDKQGTIDLILANDVVVYCAVNCSVGTSSSDYCDASSVSGVSGGLAFSVDDSYGQVFGEIEQEISNTYIVKYRSGNSVRDGTERNVVCVVDNGFYSDFVESSYIPNGLPVIRLTANTLVLHRKPLAAGSSPTIAAEIRDDYEPYIQEATLYVRRVGYGSDYQAINMTGQGGDIYAAQVPSNLVYSPGIEYYIRAADGEFNVSEPRVDPEMYPHQIAVMSNEAPSITHEPEVDWSRGQDLNLEIQASDDTNGMVELKVFHRHAGQFLWNCINVPYSGLPTNVSETISISGSELDVPAIEYYIKVTDDLGISSVWPVGGADNPYVLSSESSLHVLCVGMDYGTGLNGQADAEAVHAILQLYPHYAQTNPEPLILDPCQVGNKVILQEELNAIASNLSPGDDFIFYFSGHGFFPGFDGDEETPVEVGYGPWALWNMNDEYLGLQSPDWIWADNLSDDELISKDYFGTAVWDRVDKLVILDVCHAGGFWGEMSIIDEGDLEKLPRMALLGAAGEWGPAFSIPFSGRGLWTSLALEPALFSGGSGDSIAAHVGSWDWTTFDNKELFLREAPDYFPPDNTMIVFDEYLWDPVFYKSEGFSIFLPPIGITYNLTVEVAGSNGSLQPVGGVYDAGAVVPLTATPDQYFQVKAWQGTVDDESQDETNLVVVDSNKTVTVGFEPLALTLTTRVNGGNGQITPVGGTYDGGTVVTLTATPDQYFRVKAWQGTEDDTSTDTSNTVFIDFDKNVTVEFEPIPLSLTTQVNGGYGQITPTSAVYDAGTTIALTAIPDQYCRIKSWHGTDDDSSTALSNSVFLDVDKTVSVEFEPIPVNLTINVVGVGGAMPQTSGTRNMGTVESLSVTLEPGYRVKSWHGTEDDFSHASVNTVTMNSDREVTVELASIMIPIRGIVRAGRERGRDFIIVSGTFNPSADDIAHADAVYVKIWSDVGFAYQPDDPIPFDPDNLKRDRFIYQQRIKKGDPAGIAFLKLDLRKHTFLLLAKNLDCTGMGSPVLVDIIFGNHIGMAEVKEDTMNGRKYVPMVFMKYYMDSLRLDKPPRFRAGKREKTDFLTLRGSIAVKSMSFNLVEEDLSVTWGNQAFLIPQGSFQESTRGKKYVCRNIENPTGNGISTARMDFDKCTFRIQIKNANIEFQSGSGDFGITFGEFNETIEVNLP